MTFERHYHIVNKDGSIVEQKNIRPPFEHQEDIVNKMIDKLNVDPVTMQGLHNDLVDLKKALDNIIGTTEYFYLDYALSEVWYHWPRTPENIAKVNNMRTILNGIQENMMLAYAYILAGLGEKLIERNKLSLSYAIQ